MQTIKNNKIIKLTEKEEQLIIYELEGHYLEFKNPEHIVINYKWLQEIVEKNNTLILD